MQHRRDCFRTLGGIASALALHRWWSGSSFAQENPSVLFLPDDIDRAVELAVDFLVASQREDGAIADRGHDVAMSALAIMAMASIGTEPVEENERGAAMLKALQYVLRSQNQDSTGYFGGRDGSRMYGHGIITLMLTEVLGTCGKPAENQAVHEKLVNAIKLILASQEIPKPDKLVGGWRYTPASRDSDLSVSVWQLMALRSAKNDGLNVPGEAIEKALAYLKNSYASPLLPDGSPRDAVSGFSYTPGTHHPSFAMTAAGLLAMQVCGQYESPLVKSSAEWLLQHPPRLNERFFFYGLYYYAQGMHQVGGKFAAKADSLVPEILLAAQRGDGAWLAKGGEERNYGAVYATALAVLSLSVRYHYLPIYQR